jgi:hypothetical protein
VDDGMVEVFSGGGVAGALLPSADGDPALRVSGVPGRQVSHVTVHAMERFSG